jgi:hypothetical protein
MAEYVLSEGDTHVEVARRLLAEVDDPQAVVWAPRPDVPFGGVYVVNDEAAVAKVAAEMKTRRDAEATRIADAKAAADERDARASETGLTPAQLGIPANTGTDPGAPGTAGTLAPVDGDGADAEDAEPVEDDPATAEDESKMTPAQRRKAKRDREAAKAAADSENVASTEGAAQEEVK